MTDESQGLVHVEEGKKPEAVLEAERAVRRLGLELMGAGTAAVVLWLLLAVSGTLIAPLSWVGVFLAALVLFFFFPQTRRARVAREVLRHWDDAQVRGSLESSGTTTDPRLEAAERMGKRILRHPSASGEMQQLASDLVVALRQTTGDQRIIEVLLESRADASRDVTLQASLRDSLDYLEARAGRLLGALAEVHSAVVKRDADQVGKVLREAGEVLAELDAQTEIDRLLGGGEE